MRDVAGVRAVIDVLLQGEGRLGTLLASDQTYRVNLKKERRRAALIGRLRIEDRRLPEGQLETLNTARILVQQVPKIGRRRGCACNRQQHGRLSVGSNSLPL